MNSLGCGYLAQRLYSEAGAMLLMPPEKFSTPKKNRKPKRNEPRRRGIADKTLYFVLH